MSRRPTPAAQQSSLRSPQQRQPPQPASAPPALPGPLLIDSGNSRVKWLALDGAGNSIASGAYDHGEGDVQLAGEWAALSRPASVWISNVAGPNAAKTFEMTLSAGWPGIVCNVVRAQPQQCDVINGYRDPTQLGSDRWASLIAARALYPGENLIIATVGTATTVELMLADGRFVGGRIAPGLDLMFSALGRRTAQLPDLNHETENRPEAVNPEDDTNNDSGHGANSLFASDTASSISIGCIAAQAGFIWQAWHDASTDLPGVPIKVLLTGGGSHAVAARLSLPTERHGNLVLAGLALIAAANSAEPSGNPSNRPSGSASVSPSVSASPSPSAGSGASAALIGRIESPGRKN